MKKILLTFLLLILIFIAVSLYINRPEAIIANLIKDKNIAEKKLTYIASIFGVLPVARAEFSTTFIEDYNGTKGNEVYRLSAQAKNLNIYSKFFQGEAVLDSYVDALTFNPFLFVQKVSMSGKKEAVKEVSYNQLEQIMTLNGERRQIPAGTQDPLSAVFNIRRMDFSKVKDFEMNINTNQKNYLLKGVVQLKTLRVGGQKIEVAIVDATIARREKSPYHKSSIRMVLWRDKGNLPVYIKVFASGFLLTNRLVSIK